MLSLDLVGFINHNSNIEPDNVILANNYTVAISTISTNREINILDLSTGNIKCRLEIKQEIASDLDIQYSKDGKTLLIYSVSKGHYSIYRIDDNGCYFVANINQDDSNDGTLAKLSGDGSTLVISGTGDNMLYIYTKARDWKIPYIVHVPDNDYNEREVNDLAINYNATRIAISINGKICDPNNQGCIVIYDLSYRNNDIASLDSMLFNNPVAKMDDVGFIGSVFGVALAMSDCGDRLAVTVSDFYIHNEELDADNYVCVFSHDNEWFFERAIEDEENINPHLGFSMAFDKSGDLLFVSDIQRDLKDINFLNLVRVFNRQDDLTWCERDFIYQVKKDDPSILRLSQCDENIAIVYNGDGKVADIYQISNGDREQPLVMH